MLSLTPAAGPATSDDTARALLRRDMFVKLVQLRALDLLAEDVALEPPGQHSTNLVLHVGARGHGEYVVEFFEGALFGLGHPVEVAG